MKVRQWFRLMIGCAAFGTLMGIRPEFEQTWVRIGLAVLASVSLVAAKMWASSAR